jgi:hypothetical protein
MSSGTIVVVVVATGLTVAGIGAQDRRRRRRPNRLWAELLDNWIVLFSAVSQRRWNESRLVFDSEWQVYEQLPPAKRPEAFSALPAVYEDLRTLQSTPGDRAEREAMRALARLEGVLVQQTPAGVMETDIEQFLDLPLEQRVGDAREAHRLVSRLPRRELREAARALERQPVRIRAALGTTPARASASPTDRAGDLSDILRKLVDRLGTWPDGAAMSADRSTQGNKQPQSEVALNYIKLVEDAAVRSNHTAGRLYLVRVILTLVLLALALGIASIDEKFELAGLSFEVKLWLLLVVMSVFALVLELFDIPYYERGHRLGWRAACLYEELGYDVPRDAWHTLENPLGLQFAAAAPHDSLMRRLSYNMASAGGQVFAALLLFATQAYVFYRLTQDFHTFPVWLFALVPVLALGVGCARFIAMLNAFRRGERPWYGTSTKPPLTIRTAIRGLRAATSRGARAGGERLSS